MWGESLNTKVLDMKKAEQVHYNPPEARPSGQIYHYRRTSHSKTGSDNNANAFFTGFRHKNSTSQSDETPTIGNSEDSQWEIIDKEDTFLNNMTSVAKETQSILNSSKDLKQSVLQLTKAFESSVSLKDAKAEKEQFNSGSCVDGERCTFTDCTCRSGKWSPYLKFSMDDMKDDTAAIEKEQHSGDTQTSGFVEDHPPCKNDNWKDGHSSENALTGMVGNVTDSDNSDTRDQSSSSRSKRDSSDWYTAPNTPEDYCLVDMSSSLEESGCPTEFMNYESDDDKYSPQGKQTSRSYQKIRDRESSSSRHYPSPTLSEDKKLGRPNYRYKPFNQAKDKNKSNSEKQGQGDGEDVVIAAGRREEEIVMNKQNEAGLPETPPRFKPVAAQALILPDPPVISVSNLQYEVDQITGKAVSIGKGSFGQVFKAQFANPDFRHYPIVVKEFDKEYTTSKEVCEECQRLIYLKDTDYVPVCYGLVPFGDPQNPMYGIVQEYVGTGLTLEMFLWDQSEMEFLSWVNVARQCCEGLARFHEKGILLNDIKTNNILLDYQDHNDMVLIKYIDFGLATDMRGKRFKNSKSLEHFAYLAPEVRLHGQRTTLATDVYSLGYMLDQIHTYADISDLESVVKSCMKVDSAQRISARHAATLLENLIDFLTYGEDPYYRRMYRN